MNALAELVPVGDFRGGKGKDDREKKEKKRKKREKSHNVIHSMIRMDDII